MRRLAAWLLAIGNLPLVAGPTLLAAGQDFEDIRIQIRQALVEKSVPSIAVAVAQDDQILWEEGFGWADWEGRVPATAHTVYAVGSISKTMTATAVMLLSDRGLIDLDRPIGDYLESAKIRARIGSPAHVTIRRILSHSSGLPGYYDTFYPDEPETPPTIETIIGRYGYLMKPVDTWQYSNLGYAILGDLVSRLSGKDFADFMREEVFLPLGMNRSCVRVEPALEPHRAIGYRRGRQGSDFRVPRYVSAHPPAADVHASAHDLVRYGMFHMKVNLTSQRKLLSDQTIDEMQVPVVPIDSGPDMYGLGWHLAKDEKGHRVVKHGGAGAGVSAFLTLIPERRIAVAVVANQTHSFPQIHPTEEVTEAILSRLLGYEFRGRERGGKDETIVPGSGLPGELLGTWKGAVHTYLRKVPVSFWFKESGDVHVQLDGQLTTLVNNARFLDGTFAGRMMGRIPTPPAGRRPHFLSFGFNLREGVLSGLLAAVGEQSARGLYLPYWVEVRRQVPSEEMRSEK